MKTCPNCKVDISVRKPLHDKNKIVICPRCKGEFCLYCVSDVEDNHELICYDCLRKEDV